MAKKTTIIPRGIRNNNPLNIRIGNQWLGERANPNDPAFEQFVAMEYGIRAGFVLLRRYIRHYKRTTVAAIIEAWAPANENNTQRYIDMVSRMADISPTEAIRYDNKDMMVRLVDAMIRVECGQPVERRIIEKGYEIYNEKDQLVERRTRSGARPCGRPVRSWSRNNDVRCMMYDV